MNSLTTPLFIIAFIFFLIGLIPCLGFLNYISLIISIAIFAHNTIEISSSKNMVDASTAYQYGIVASVLFLLSLTRLSMGGFLI